MSNDTPSRRAAAIELLSKAGLRRDEYAPPAFRLLWHLGVDIPPPHFMSPGKLALFLGTFFFIGIAIAMLFISALAMPELPTVAVLILCLFGGIAFGTIMARYYVALHKRYCLPSWQDLPLR